MSELIPPLDNIDNQIYITNIIINIEQNTKDYKVICSGNKEYNNS